ncbi:hypothetical protein LCGC14_1122000 [marine sediment metagenome]|uniref:MOFRL-associated domain-containing protein n=1 Tax=marine sediment metagenome TaxID=412755 RepID=A0A0F9M8G5_9ZZZZ
MICLYIKNISELLENNIGKQNLELRKKALDLLENSIQAVRPKILVEKSIKIQDKRLYINNDEYNLGDFNKLYIIGGGKATAEMAFSIENIITKYSHIEYGGIINVPKGTVESELAERSKIKINYASHPIPDENGLKGTKRMMKIIENSLDNDLILCLISGGGSALLPLPKEGISLDDLQEINSLLLASGASIHEVNSIRKHISDFKGGNLVKKLDSSSKAYLISLIISDVVGDNLDSIASGPTVPDSTTFKESVEILKKYELYDKIPLSIKNHFEEGLINNELENPKTGNVCFQNVKNYLIGGIKLAVDKIIPILKNQGYKTIYFSNRIIGEAMEFGKSLFTLISQKIKEAITMGSLRNIALIGTGELTVTIKGKGIGGRNQEMLLAFLDCAKERGIDYNFIVIGANMDGKEGNSEAMGALVDNYVLKEVVTRKIDIKNYLNLNDSNTFFKLLKSEIITGLTGCNVNDLILTLVNLS